MAAEKQLLGIKGTSCATNMACGWTCSFFHSSYENYQALSNDVGACDGRALGYAWLATRRPRCAHPCTRVAAFTRREATRG